MLIGDGAGYRAGCIESIPDQCSCSSCMGRSHAVCPKARQDHLITIFATKYTTLGGTGLRTLDSIVLVSCITTTHHAYHRHGSTDDLYFLPRSSFLAAFLRRRTKDLKKPCSLKVERQALRLPTLTLSDSFVTFGRTLKMRDKTSMKRKVCEAGPNGRDSSDIKWWDVDPINDISTDRHAGEGKVLNMWSPPPPPKILNEMTPASQYDINFCMPFETLETDEIRIEPLIVR